MMVPLKLAPLKCREPAGASSQGDNDSNGTQSLPPTAAPKQARRQALKLQKERMRAAFGTAARDAIRDVARGQAGAQQRLRAALDAGGPLGPLVSLCTIGAGGGHVLVKMCTLAEAQRSADELQRQGHDTLIVDPRAKKEGGAR